MALRLRLPAAAVVAVALRASMTGARSGSATAAYKEARQAVDKKLSRLKDLLRQLDRRQRMDPARWTFQGTASSVLHDLQNVVDGLETVPGIHPAKVMAAERGKEYSPKISARRDLFAAHALEGIMADGGRQHILRQSEEGGEELDVAARLEIASMAWGMADMMLDQEEIDRG